MIKVIDKVNNNKPIKVGNVVEITECPNYIKEDTLPLKAIVIKDFIFDNYKLLNIYDFSIIRGTAYDDLETLVKEFGLVFYSDNISLIIE